MRVRGHYFGLGGVTGVPGHGPAALPDSGSCSDTVEEDEDLYDCVENEEAEGDEIYEDLMRSEPVPMLVRGGEGSAGLGVGGASGGGGQPQDPQHLLLFPALSPR